MMIEFWNLFECYLWDVFDVNPDVDNCWTLGWQFKLNVVLRHTDALCLKKETFEKRGTLKMVRGNSAIAKAKEKQYNEA